MSQRVQTSPLRIAAVYLLFGSLWILFSDTLVDALTSDPAWRTKLQLIKGWVFVAVTALLLYLVLRRHFMRLQAENLRARLLIEHAPAALAIFDREMRYLSVSRRWREDYGLGDRPMAGISHYELFPEIPERWKALHRRALAGEILSEERDRFERADGRVQWLTWEVRPWFDQNGEIGGVAVLTEDLTAEMHAEDTLQVSERNYRFLADNIKDVVWVYDIEEERLTYVSPSIKELLGMSQEESLEAGPTVMPSEALDAFSTLVKAQTEEFTRSEERSNDRRAEFELRHADGHPVFVEVVTNLTHRDGRLQMIGVSRDITARRAAESALRESEARFRSVVESSPYAIYVHREGRFLLLNDATVRLFGASAPADLIGQCVLEFFHPASREAVERRNRQVLEAKEPTTITTHRILRLDGSTIWAEFAGVPFDHSELPGALVFGRDVHEERLSLDRLKLHEAVLRETGEIAKVGGWSFDPATGDGYWTDEVARIHDLDPGADTSREIGLQFYTPESRRRIEEAIARALETGEPYDLELVMTTAKGKRKWVRTIGRPVFENGKVVQIRGAFQDITSQLQTLVALRQSEERLSLIAENIDEIFWLREDDVIRYISPAFEEIYGRPVDDVLSGKIDLLETIHPDDHAIFSEDVHERQRRGEFDETFRILRPDGEVRWIHSRAFPVPASKDSPARIVGVAEDITARRALEDQLLHAQKLEAMGTLAGGIAHDFNNVLGAIMAFAELAREEAPAGSTLDEYLQGILTGSRRGADLVRKILTFCRETISERKVILLRPMIHEALDLLRATIPATVTIERRIAPEIVPVLADSSQIHQVVMNLGTNAWHAMKGHHGTIEIGLQRLVVDEAHPVLDPPLREGTYAHLSVRDDGCGMSADIQKRIFEPFYTTKGPQEGTGLGLSVVHGIVRAHNGEITVQSAPGKGTTFHLYLPSVETQNRHAEKHHSSLPQGNGERILLVDDEVDLRRAGSEMLLKLGYCCETAANAEDAIQRFATDPKGFDLLITDHSMPGLSGLELVSRLRRLQPQLPVIMVTSHSSKLDPDAIRASELENLVYKPFTMNTFALAIHYTLH